MTCPQRTKGLAILALTVTTGLALMLCGCVDEDHIPDLPARMVSTTPTPTLATTTPVPPSLR
ncbi:hypothetical protein [Nocardia sp. NPDC002869]|uniref:hypothetical protein n=1 Tax=Nocardia sp. NPDC002869 TaxID=3161032 RepID=UPI00398D2D42